MATYGKREPAEYDELKSKVLDREEATRSKSSAAVAQELWGILLAYNLVRLEMERIADEAGVESTRISFVAACRHACDEWLWSAVASPGAIPKYLRELRANSASRLAVTMSPILSADCQGEAWLVPGDTDSVSQEETRLTGRHWILTPPSCL